MFYQAINSARFYLAPRTDIGHLYRYCLNEKMYSILARRLPGNQERTKRYMFRDREKNTVHSKVYLFCHVPIKNNLKNM
jgi:hypothetical protein